MIANLVYMADLNLVFVIKLPKIFNKREQFNFHVVCISSAGLYTRAFRLLNRPKIVRISIFKAKTNNRFGYIYIYIIFEDALSGSFSPK